MYATMEARMEEIILSIKPKNIFSAISYAIYDAQVKMHCSVEFCATN